MGTADDDAALAGISVVNGRCEVLLDRLVAPDAMPTDLRTAITGIAAKDLEGIRYSREDARPDLLKLMVPGAIFVGHTMDKDLAALRLDVRRLVLECVASIEKFVLLGGSPLLIWCRMFRHLSFCPRLQLLRFCCVLQRSQPLRLFTFDVKLYQSGLPINIPKLPLLGCNYIFVWSSSREVLIAGICLSKSWRTDVPAICSPCGPSLASVWSGLVQITVLSFCDGSHQLRKLLVAAHTFSSRYLLTCV